VEEVIAGKLMDELILFKASKTDCAQLRGISYLHSSDLRLTILAQSIADKVGKKNIIVDDFEVYILKLAWAIDHDALIIWCGDRSI